MYYNYAVASAELAPTDLANIIIIIIIIISSSSSSNRGRNTAAKLIALHKTKRKRCTIFFLIVRYTETNEAHRNAFAVSVLKQVTRH